MCVYLIVKIYMHKDIITYKKSFILLSFSDEFVLNVILISCRSTTRSTDVVLPVCRANVLNSCMHSCALSRGANYIITLIVLNVSLLIKNHLSLHNIVKTPSAQNFMHTVRGIIIGKEPLLVNMLEVCGQ